MTDTKITKHEEANIALSEEMKKMYKDSANLGTANLTGGLPILKVYSAGRSDYQLADGSDPKDGSFFYQPTGEQFDEVICHILSISAPFYGKPLQEGEKDVFTQIVSGIIPDEGTGKPFHMYISKGRLEKLWAFAKDINKYTHAKPYPTPMFALTVKLTTVLEKTPYGKAWRINFDVVRDENGRPVTVTDPGQFVFLRDMVEPIENTIKGIVANKGEFALTEDQVKEIETSDPEY
jgi:hypothetical protein